MRLEAQRRQREEGGSLAVPHQHSGGAASPAFGLPTAPQPSAAVVPAAAAAQARGGDRPRRHTTPFLGLAKPKRSSWEPQDPETGGERCPEPQRQDPQPVQLPPSINGGLAREGSLGRAASNGTEMSELGRQRSDPQSFGRGGSGVRHISEQVEHDTTPDAIDS